MCCNPGKKQRVQLSSLPGGQLCVCFSYLLYFIDLFSVLRLRQLGADLASAFQVDGGMNSGHVPSGRPRSSRLPALPEPLVSFLFLFSFFFLI